MRESCSKDMKPKIVTVDSPGHGWDRQQEGVKDCTSVDINFGKHVLSTKSMKI